MLAIDVESRATDSRTIFQIDDSFSLLIASRNFEHSLADKTRKREQTEWHELGD